MTAEEIRQQVRDVDGRIRALQEQHRTAEADRDALTVADVLSEIDQLRQQRVRLQRAMNQAASWERADAQRKRDAERRNTINQAKARIAAVFSAPWTEVDGLIQALDGVDTRKLKADGMERALTAQAIRRDALTPANEPYELPWNESTLNHAVDTIGKLRAVLHGLRR